MIRIKKYLCLNFVLAIILLGLPSFLWGKAFFVFADTATTSVTVAGQDTTAPTISNVRTFSVTQDSATIIWQTDEPASSLVDYGLTTSLGLTAGDSGTFVTSHHIVLTGLSPGAIYYYQVRSIDSAGNSATNNNGGNFYTFYTLSVEGPAFFLLGPTPERPKEGPDLSKAEIYLNNGASYTSELFVKVLLKDVKNASQMRISQEPDFTGVQWQDFKEKFFWEVLPGDGKKEIFIQFKSPDGLVGEKILSESIILDTQAPASPVNFQGKAEDSHIYLSWLAPSDPDFAGVRIYKSENDFVLSPISRAEILFEGKADFAFDFEAEKGKNYFFSIFAYDYARNYSNPGLLEIKTPFLPPSFLPEEKQEVPEEKPKSLIPVKPEFKREVKEFYFDFSKKSLTLKLGLSQEVLPLEERKFRYLERTPLTIVLDERDLPKKPEKIQLVLGDVLRFGFKSQSTVWNLKLETPPIKGKFPLNLEIFYEDKTIDTIKLGEILIDPFGYVYLTFQEPYLEFLKKGLWSWELKTRKERVAFAKVTVYFFDEKEKNWQVWQAQDYEQKNPQLTSKEGEYGFMVPPGFYFLKAEKEGLGEKILPPFEVRDTIVNQNIELALLTVSWWKIGDNLLKIFGLFLVFILAIIILGAFYKRQKKKRAFHYSPF